jgi:hypothetical protein
MQPIFVLRAIAQPHLDLLKSCHLESTVVASSSMGIFVGHACARNFKWLPGLQRTTVPVEAKVFMHITFFSAELNNT